MSPPAPVDNRQQAQSPALYFGLLIVAYLLFIAFASLYVPDFISPRRAAQAGAGELFFLADEFRLRWWNLRDFSSNILLYMPLGALVALYLASQRSIVPLGLHLCWGLFLSIGLESIQAFIGRVSDATDVVSNGCGYLLGFLIARVGVMRFGVDPGSLLGRRIDNGSRRLDTLAGLRFFYLAVFLVTALLPLDFSLSLSQLVGKLQSTGGQPPQLIIDPLYHLRNHIDILFFTQTALAYMPLAFLSSTLLLLQARLSIQVPAFHCLLLALIVEGLNLFVQSGRSDIAVPLLAYGTGLLVALLVRLFGRHQSAPMIHSPVRSRQLLRSIMLLYLLFLLAVSVSPYEFELSLPIIRDKLVYSSNLLPFRLHFSARSVNSAVDIVREFILFAPLGGLLALWLRSSLPRTSTGTTLLVAGLSGLVVALAAETLQLTVVGRYVDITDVLLGALGAVGGALLAPLFWAASPPGEVP